MTRTARFVTLAVTLALLPVFVGAGCPGIQPDPTQDQWTQLRQAEQWYLATWKAGEESATLVKSWADRGIITPTQADAARAVHARYVEAMNAWKRLLVAAKDNGGTLPADHPAVMQEANLLLGSLRALVLGMQAREPDAASGP